VSGAICPGRQLALPSQGAEARAVNEKCQHFPVAGQPGALVIGAGLAAFRGYSVISMVSLIVAPVATSGIVRSKGTTSPGQKTDLPIVTESPLVAVYVVPGVLVHETGGGVGVLVGVGLGLGLGVVPG